MSDIYILAIESSCDDTSAAILKNKRVLSNVVSSQIIHTDFGGVVPELASREHQKNIVFVVNKALKQAQIEVSQISAIAYTKVPGLIGALLVGSAFAKSMALAMGIPLIGVHHMQAHILAHFIEDASKKTPSFPFLAMTISGGHTQIVQVNSHFDMVLIGQTTDDAAGEAFDKSAKLLGLEYPGGPLIDRLSQKGNPYAYTFPKPKVSNLDFSFSGLKTAILYFIKNNVAQNPEFITKNRNDICASIQYTIIEILMEKLQKAVIKTGIKRVAIGGGVSANSQIREKLKSFENRLGWDVYIPKFEYTTDNAAMIGITGFFKYFRGEFDDMSVVPQARLPI